MILWQTNINKLTKLHISVPAAFWDEHFSWRKRNFCKFFEFCGKESRQACQKFLLLTVGTFREFTFAGETKKFFLNVFLIWAGTDQTFGEIKFAVAVVVGLQTCNSKIRREEWNRMMFFLLKSKCFSSYRFWNFGKKFSLFHRKNSSRWEKNL